MENQTLSQSQMGVKPVASTLRAMNIGDYEEFPIKDLLAVQGARFRLQKQLKIRFSQRTTEDFITLTRTA